MDNTIKTEDKLFFAEKLKYSIEFGIDFDSRTIYIFDELTEVIGTNLRIKYNLIKQWWKNIEKKEFNDINLDISSFGGSIYAITSALDFYDELKKRDNVVVNTKAHTVCMSAATILMAGGTGERTATERCKWMLHDIQVDNIGGSVKQLQTNMATLDEEQLEMFSFYAIYANKDKKFTEKELKKEAEKWIKKYTKNNTEHYLSSKEILELKLIDRIL